MRVQGFFDAAAVKAAASAEAATGSNKMEADRIVIRLSEFNRLQSQVQGFRRLQRLHKAQQEHGYYNVTEADDTGMLLRHIKTMVGYSNGRPEHFDALPVDVHQYWTKIIYTRSCVRNMVRSIAL